MEIGEMLAGVQTISILIGIAMVVVKFGRRDQQLEDNTSSIKELRKLSQDLLKLITQASTNVGHHAEDLDELKRRIEKLEDRNARADSLHHTR